MKAIMKISIIILVFIVFSSWTENNYSSIKIGDQEWMIKNLDVTSYQNGDKIPQVQNEEEWKKLKVGAWCYYENRTENGVVYGKLYNWFAVKDKRGLAPKGWHIPSEAESEKLISYLVEMQAGNKIKTTKGWNDYKGANGNGTNESGFSGLPGGDRGFDGKFANFGCNGEWWTSTEDGLKWAKAFYVTWNDARAVREGFNKQNGCSIRCIKN